MVSLSWKHHTLIQALISRGPLKEREFYSIFTGVTGRNPGTVKKHFDKYLLEINKELSYVHFELKACRDQYDGQVCYGVVNNVSDDQSKLGTKYSVPQIAFFKGIIEAIAQDEAAQGCISGFDALNIRLENQISSEASSSQQQVPAAFKNFSMSQKEKTLDELVRDKWLCRTREGNIGLGIRSLLDLRSWFRNSAVPPCEVCNEAGVKADVCPSEGCAVRIHKYCLKQLLSQRDDKRCSGCGKQWPLGKVTKAEAVEEAMNDEEENETQATGPKSKRRRQHRSHEDPTENSASQASLASTSGANARRVTRSTAHLR
ncbi:PREDICTED: non-structural maintenance of chromosomes element 1 homolog [Camelina sativa]|uniref:Non-structural maintenance of chromosomes element 1 homolog n=1 Tax=Camelina sativa TaxID=90675 RepID=A0ABM0VD78_CAMSA|nr:PREDICTED: non-structural maintenance of chromosomes element 1 homolog [Camelina sativa]